jgi:hypothetical protein
MLIPQFGGGYAHPDPDLLSIHITVSSGGRNESQQI